jgi:starch synthase
MKVLFLAAEATPFIKVGGLADVAGELPPVLEGMGVNVRLVIPFHAPMRKMDIPLEPIADVEVSGADGQEHATLLRSILHGRSIYLIDGASVRAVEGVYSTPEKDARKFIFFSISALKAVQDLQWQVDLIHAHDWHAAAAIAWIDAHRKMNPFWEHVATLLTVHNLPYMGAGGEEALTHYGFSPCADPRLPEWARTVPLAMGLATSDWINAVSPTYAEEIQTPQFGHGLEGLLVGRRERLVGILNGIDINNWNPETDPDLAERYSCRELRLRRVNKAYLQNELNLTEDARVPLLSMVTRLDRQKGIDIALQAIGEILDMSWQFVLWGSGDAQLEAQCRAFADMHPDRVRFVQRFDLGLARRIYGGTDMLLVPSRYEPCGLTQMIAMRYGCVPIVSSTGGLRDTVRDVRSEEVGTGFIFQPTEPYALANTLREALPFYADQRRWRGIQLRGMSQDFSWRNSANQYCQLYAKAIKGRMGRSWEK